ncbi:MAG: PilZ domain-containing protein [Acidobacteria bacterium]|nr:PilZ domain-containing protein [Acidobacteriota bacterium]
MFHSVSDDRRRHKRFLVKGQAVLRTPAGVSGDKVDEVDEVINVSAGGLLVLSKIPPRVGTDVETRFAIQGYNTEIHARGRIIRTEIGLAGISFLEEPEGLQALMAWLEAGLIADFLSP